MPANPQSEQELLNRAYAMAGFTLAQLAVTAGIPVPRDLRRDKGWTGQLIEWQLGASAGSRPEQDFPDLGIELKTIPVDPQGRPLETTFVCVAPLIGVSGQRWEESNVRNKLSRVLWIPVEGSRDIPVGDRRVGMPLLWSPNEEEEGLLRQDWEELMDMIVLGEVEQISARHGQVLQLRPKAANSKALTRAIGRNGQPIMTLPRGFYLKIEFTHQLLQRHFALPL
ncbi:DNA mismatch repair protein MutH [Aeromonas caviae]|uniref:DNA mismatch repair protein MutH n=1 Tax=Aeromonas caviae TaxID=648 RepID=A0ABD0B5U5_AERCA|nr:DNA mismatch repair endonuclease MutH [Aeromonas caviae]MBL0502356.1 DNA mismatch repair endonuclease MutH [Aeromonas caviae]BCR27585.1 DNA mismatch repair protein MutH [Aeromonas caviae]GJA80179.1 DNA mismatch repair protein MutH [Aeromonas caviae]GJA99045.1 DNA mismatch repair protein MutH [Aeromonas caviae]GJB12330.1 DNA mismatch repair protein MutH [Aeromonas caviae]